MREWGTLEKGLPPISLAVGKRQCARPDDLLSKGVFLNKRKRPDAYGVRLGRRVWARPRI